MGMNTCAACGINIHHEAPEGAFLGGWVGDDGWGTVCPEAGDHRPEHDTTQACMTGECPLCPEADLPEAEACEGEWRHVDTIHGNVQVFRCSGCRERMVTYNGRRVDVPADVISRKAIVRLVRAS
jgi:hypothetical protein